MRRKCPRAHSLIEDHSKVLVPCSAPCSSQISCHLITITNAILHTLRLSRCDWSLQADALSCKCAFSSSHITSSPNQALGPSSPFKALLIAAWHQKTLSTSSADLCPWRVVFSCFSSLTCLLCKYTALISVSENDRPLLSYIRQANANCDILTN